jgi:neutral ceramidase
MNRCILIALLATLSAVAQDSKSGIRAGFAYRDITPDIGMEQPGGYGKSYHTSFHDACKVRAAVFDDGKQRVAVVGLDLLAISRPVVLAAREQIQKATGIPGHAVLLCCSHSHSSGPVGMVQPGEYDSASDAVKQLAYEESSMADKGFLQHLTRQIAEGVRAATAAVQPVRLGFGYGHEDKVAFNRRMKMKQGQAWSHPGAGNPDILGYAGPIDPQVGVIGAWSVATNELVGVVVNYACHATTNPGGISANWPYYMEQTIQGAMHSAAPVVFLQGACGDITQVDNLSPYKRPEAEAWSQQVGGRIGAEAVKTLLMMTAKSESATLSSEVELLRIPRRQPSTETLQQARATLAAGKPKGDTTDWLFAKESLLLEHLCKVSPEVEVEVQAIQVGPVCLVSNPAEYFVEYGLRIKKESPFPMTFPCELANGCVGYVPTEEAFAENGGGYETRLTSYSNLEITAGTEIADAGIRLAQKLKPDTMPEPAKVPFSGRPWRYGNVAPGLK